MGGVRASLETRPDPALPPKRFVLLDSLRGYAALAVMASHFDGIHGHVAAYMMVDFFLALSGFVLMHAYFSKPSLSFWDFAWARFARLYPLHLATLLAFVAIYMLQDRYVDRSSLAMHLAMVHHVGFGPAQLHFNPPSWSIAVEFWVNMLVAAALVLLPVLHRRMGLRWGLLAALAALCFAVLALQLGHLNAHRQNAAPGIGLGLLRGLASFSLGMIVYDLYRLCLPRLTDRARRWIAWLTPLALLLFGLCAWIPAYRTALDFAFIPLFCAVVFLGAFEAGPAAALAKRAHYLGAISFAVYLTHRPVMEAMYFHVPEDLPVAVRLALIVPVVIAVSIAAHHLFERPVYRALRHAGRRAAGWLSAGSAPG